MVGEAILVLPVAIRGAEVPLAAHQAQVATVVEVVAEAVLLEPLPLKQLIVNYLLVPIPF